MSAFFDEFLESVQIMKSLEVRMRSLVSLILMLFK